MHIYDAPFWMLISVIACCTYYIYQLTFMNNELLCSSNVRSSWIIFSIYYIFNNIFHIIELIFTYYYLLFLLTIMELRIKYNF